MGNAAQSDEKEEEDYSQYFTEKPLFGDPKDFGVVINTKNSEDIKDDDSKNENENKTYDDDYDDDDYDTDDSCEQEACIIDEQGHATEVTYIRKKDFASWSINKIIKKSNFTQSLKDNSKQIDENTQFWKFLEKKIENYDNCVAASKKKVQYLCKSHNKLVSKMSFDEIAAILLYTTNDVYGDLNNSLRQRQAEYAPFCGPLLSGLSKLPFEWNTLYRGVAYSPLVETINEKYRVGTFIRWDSFASTTTDLKVAIFFATLKPSEKACIFEIESGFRGRDIAKFSAFKRESEILFSISSHFVVTKIYEKDKITWVRCKEIPFPWDSKTILWVDDNPKNNKELMEQFEQDGVMVIPRISTYGATELLDFMINAINIHTFNQFRVITDMHRFEWDLDDKTKQKSEDKEAGITLIKDLRSRGYKNKVCIYTGHKDITVQKCKDAKIYDNTVLVTESREDVIKYASFQ